MIINKIWFRCKACDKEIVPHVVKIKVPEGEPPLEQWEWLCSSCKAKVPHWNPNTEQWNNDDSSIRFNTGNMGDALGEMLHCLHNGGSSGGSFNSLD
jgi:hypothetical protein